MNSNRKIPDPDILTGQTEEAMAFLEELFDRLPAMLKAHEKFDRAFRKRSYKRWKDGLDLLKMFVVMSEEFGSTINDRERARAVAGVDYRFEAAIALHARGIRVSNEVLALLREGFPDGALSRWRTLHEIGVISTFLAKNDPDVSLRFLAHRGIASAKAIRQYAEYLPRSRMAPLQSGDLERAQVHRDELITQFGLEFGDDMGWAFPVIRKRQINLYDLECATGLDHWRPRFKWASDDIHVGAKPHSASLGMAERPKNKPGLLTGRSDSAFTDPAHMTAISLNLANHAIPVEYRDDDEEMILIALRTLSDLLGQTFVEIAQGPEAKQVIARHNSERP